MLVEYKNKIYRREEKLPLSFCENSCPLKEFEGCECYLDSMPYICIIIGNIRRTTSKIFKL
jgi:hypothetical protein